MSNNYQQQVIDFFNSRTTYDAEGDSHPREAKRLLEYVALESGQNVLDLATGTGLVAIDAAKKVTSTGSVIGVDISPGMLSQAREKIVAEG
ncbi:MAG: methyltransferase domain-containing protein, partial [Waterburya sp.]